MNRHAIINHLLLSSKKSIVQISKYLNINRSNIYLWKSGKTKPKIEHINRLADLNSQKIQWIDSNNIELINEPKETETSITNQKNNIFLKKLVIAQEETIKLQKDRIKQLDSIISFHDKGKFNKPYPDGFDDMVKMVESAQNTWEWSFQESPTPMAMSDRYNLIRANSALVKQLKYKNSIDLIGKAIADLVHQEERSYVKAQLDKNIRRFACRLLKGDGNYSKVKINSRIFSAQFGNTYSVAHIKIINK